MKHALEVIEVLPSQLTDEEFAVAMRSGIPNILPVIIPDNRCIDEVAASIVRAEERGDIPRMQYRPNWP